jgi:prolyl-tRNA synthetase
VDDINKYQEGQDCPKCEGSKLTAAKAAEVGNVFDLGQKYTKAFDLKFVDEKGKPGYPIMGCYGIGISRTMGVLVENFHDDKGIIWPKEVAPYQVHLIAISGGNDKIQKQAEKIFAELESAGVEVLFDDREDAAAGAKLNDADLIGLPYRVVVSAKTGEKVELKERSEKEGRLVTAAEVIKQVMN